MSEDPVIDRHLRSVLADRADVLGHLTDAHDAAVEAVPDRLLELCRHRVATLLGAPTGPARAVDEATLADVANWPTADAFDATDRACLAFTEQWVIDVAGLDDDTATAVRDALGDQGLADFSHALLVIEQRLRLHLIWQRLFEGTEP